EPTDAIEPLIAPEFDASEQRPFCDRVLPLSDSVFVILQKTRSGSAVGVSFMVPRPVQSPARRARSASCAETGVVRPANRARTASVVFRIMQCPSCQSGLWA